MNHGRSRMSAWSSCGSERRWLHSFWVVAVVSGLVFQGCHDGPEAPKKFPKEIDKIIRTSCAVSGCHNAKSKDAAAGLNLESWDALFEGSRGGSAVIPYSPDQSFLLYSINVDSSLGPVLKPTMPIGHEPLEAIDYQLIRHWILAGAKNRDKEERFPPMADRQKWYIGHYGCDVVAVIDVESRQIMRYVSVGADADLDEALYDVTVDPNGEFWYAAFTAHNATLEKYSTLTDEKVATIPLGHAGWNNLTISPDGKLGFLVSLSAQAIAVIDLQAAAMAGITYPLGLDAINAGLHPIRQQVYVPAMAMSHLVVLDYDGAGNLGNRRDVDLVQGVPGSTAGNLKPVQVVFLPDGSKYFVACLNSKEIRVFDGVTDSLLQVIVLPASPANLAYSATTGRVFASCPDDAVSFPTPDKLGSIAVIDAATLQLEGMRYAGFQPYGLTVDEAAGLLIVAARNQLPTGPASHHQSACGGRNGYLNFLDLRSLTVLSGYKPELSVDPVTLHVKH